MKINSQIKLFRVFFKSSQKSFKRMVATKNDIAINPSVYPIARREPIVDIMHGKEVFNTVFGI